MLDDTNALETAEPLIVVNSTTKEELLTRAKAAIDAGEQSLHDAAEALAVAQDLHGATQAEMARAVGKSEAWVSYLLRWRRSGYKDASPFGPTTKVGRLKHAEDRTVSRASKPRKSKAPSADTTSVTSGNGAIATDSVAPNSKKPSAAEAKGNLMYAIDHWWRYLDDAGKVEMTAYFLKKTGARVS
jgi:hypothetical protein